LSSLKCVIYFNGDTQITRVRPGKHLATSHSALLRLKKRPVWSS
jgi:hypothetical protein